jgi:hypothetical protein
MDLETKMNGVEMCWSLRFAKKKPFPGELSK